MPIDAVFIGSGTSMLLQESLLDGNWMRFALLVTAPFTFCVSIVRVFNHQVRRVSDQTLQFFCNQIIGNIGMMCAMHVYPCRR